MEQRLYKTELTKKTEIADNVVELCFKKPEKFEYIAGQFVQFSIPANNGKEILRSYSISSAPTDTNIRFCIKLLKDGIGSNFCKNLSIGDTLSFYGPNGRFIVQQNTMPLYFVATGVGLAPIMAILRDQIENKKTEKSIHLLFGIRSQKDIFWKKELEKLSILSTQFTYTISLSQPTNTWNGSTGRVTEHLTNISKNANYFICGSIYMIKDVRVILSQKEIEGRQIHFEIF